MWCRSCKRYLLRALCILNCSPTQWHRQIWVYQDSIWDTPYKFQCINKINKYMHVRSKLDYNFNISTGYPIGTLWKLYEDNQETIKILFSDMITPQDIPLDFLINALHNIQICKHLTWLTHDQTCNLLKSTPNPMEGKVSGILLAVWFASASTVYLEMTHGLDFKTPTFPLVVYKSVAVLTSRIHIWIFFLYVIF